MKTIKIFRHEQFGEIRICLAENKELFCLSDVCKALAIGNPSDVKRRLSGRGVVTIETPIKNQYGTVVAQKLIYVDEPNLYRCIFQSRKAEAEQFQNWVFEEVLPQIRLTGGYIPVCKDDDESAIQRRAIDIMNRTIERMKPKAVLALADEIIGKELSETNKGSENTLTATQVAKTFNMSVFNFNAVLRNLGIQYRRGGRWNISDDLADRDFVRLRTHVSYSLKGRKKVRTYMTWTMSGLHYLNAKLGYPNF